MTAFNYLIWNLDHAAGIQVLVGSTAVCRTLPITEHFVSLAGSIWVQGTKLYKWELVSC